MTSLLSRRALQMANAVRSRTPPYSVLLSAPRRLMSGGGDHSEFPHGPTQIVNGEIAEDTAAEDEFANDVDVDGAAILIRPQSYAEYLKNVGLTQALAIAAGVWLVYEYASMFFPYDFGGNRGVRESDKAKAKAAAASAEAEADTHDDADADADADTHDNADTAAAESDSGADSEADTDAETETE